MDTSASRRRADRDGALIGVGRRLGLAILLALVGCAGGSRPSERRAVADVPTLPAIDHVFPVVPCANAVRPETVGLWQFSNGEPAFVYDGCSLRFRDTLESDPPIFNGRRTVARAFHIDVRDYADPFPYFRTRARWDGARLQTVSILAVRDHGRWDGERFWWPYGSEPLSRAEAESELGIAARELLFVERFLPTEREIAAERGVTMPPGDGCVPPFIEAMLDPTAGCEDTPMEPSGPE